MMQLTRRYRFSASHRLHAPEFSDAENAALYGKCNNPLGHGHEYVLEVSVEGPVDAATGQVADRGALDRLVEESVLSRLRHRDLNTEAQDIAGPVPTTERLAEGILGRLREGWPKVFSDGRPRLAGVRVRETRRNMIELAQSI